MASDAAQFTGSIPENYDEWLVPHLFDGYADDLARRVLALRPRTVLELAAGTGILSRKLRDGLPNDSDLVASDLNAPMLDIARTKFQPGESVRFEQVDAIDLKFADASFDAVACQFGIMFFPDKARSYTEVHRVLKPGGSYLFNVWDSWEQNPFAQIAHQVVETTFPNDPPGFYKVPFGYYDAGEIRKAVAKAGFSKVTVEHLPLTSPIASAANFAKGLVFGNPLQDEILARGGNPEAVCTQVEKAIERNLGTDLSLQALIVHAYKA
ncbi:MAG: methyltransferase domain-containing protein [Betaproteobacteria bacterium]|nr:MAG: methyltransferase domain-containing protein [Betaproteobacteria bacterium]